MKFIAGRQYLVGFKGYGLSYSGFQYFLGVVFPAEDFQLVPAVDDGSGLSYFYLIITGDESVDAMLSDLYRYCIGRNKSFVD